MTIDAETIERIVAGVLEQLGEPPKPLRAAEPAAAPATHTEMVIHESVITAQVLEQRVNGARCLKFGARSILTPSAHDFLRTRQIEWSRESSSESKRQAGGRLLAILVRTTDAAKSALDDAAKSKRWNRELAGTAREAAECTISAVCRGDAERVVIFTADPHTAACRANRNRRIRAAVVSNTIETQAVLESIGANVLAVDPNGKSYIELRNILRTFAAAGPPEPPPNWE